MDSCYLVSKVKMDSSFEGGVRWLKRVFIHRCRSKGKKEKRMYLKKKEVE